MAHIGETVKGTKFSFPSVLPCTTFYVLTMSKYHGRPTKPGITWPPNELSIDPNRMFGARTSPIRGTRKRASTCRAGRSLPSSTGATAPTNIQVPRTFQGLGRMAGETCCFVLYRTVVGCCRPDCQCRCTSWPLSPGGQLRTQVSQ